MIIPPPKTQPCRCAECMVAGVSDQFRPGEQYHGRELQRWWAGYRLMLEAARRLPRREMQPGGYIPQTDPNGHPL